MMRNNGTPFTRIKSQHHNKIKRVHLEDLLLPADLLDAQRSQLLLQLLQLLQQLLLALVAQLVGLDLFMMDQPAFFL